MKSEAQSGEGGGKNPAWGQLEGPRGCRVSWSVLRSLHGCVLWDGRVRGVRGGERQPGGEQEKMGAQGESRQGMGRVDVTDGGFR